MAVNVDWLVPGAHGAVAAGRAVERLFEDSVRTTNRWVAGAGLGSEAAQFTRGYLDGRTAPPDLDPSDPMFAQLMLVAMETATERRWVEGGKAVYRLEPGLFSALGDTDPTAEIPVEVFGRIPHHSPVFLFPEPVTFTEGPDLIELRMMAVTGIQVDGSGREMLVSTAERFDRLFLMFIGPVTREEEATVEVRHHVLRLDDGRSVQELAQMSAERFRVDPDAEIDADVLRDHTEKLLMLAVSMVLYVASTEPDLEEMPVPVRKKSKGRQRAGRVPARVVDVGWVVGPALGAAGHGAGGGEGAGGTVRSHLRRAHWRRSRVGPRSDWRYELRWIGPVIVNPDDSDGVGTVVSVPPTH